MKKLYLFAFLLFIAAKSFSQFAYTAANSTIVTGGTYTDLGTTGTAIVNNALGVPITKDDDVSGPVPIGFTFLYGVKPFTQFTFNTNGFIKLGADTSSASNVSPITSNDTNLIYPYGRDLDGGATTEYRYYTSGTAGSQVCTIQYKNVKDFSATTGQYTFANFQIKLYEGTNVIEFVYGTYTASTAAAAFIVTDLGVKGDNPAASVNATKSSGTAWASATFLEGPYPANTFNNRNNFLPPSGIKFRFTPVPLPNSDASVSILNTLGKLPIAYGTPHTISTIIKNKGLSAFNNLVVSLNITGTNPFTSTKTISLPVGASTVVSFDPYSPTTPGGSTIIVTIPSDDINTNNSQSIYQTVTNNVFSYADTSASIGAVGYNTGSGLLLNKYKVNGTGTVSAVNVSIAGATAVLGNMVYAVVLNSAGAIVAKSDSIIIVAADTLQYKTFTISAGPTFVDTFFYVGLAQKANTVTGYFPVRYQSESPIKPDAYFTAPIAGGTPPAANSSIGRFMIEAVMSGTTPLNFLSFDGNLKNTTVQLNWKTANEINAKNFEVERSLNGSNFERIGLVNASRNSAPVNEYRFDDINASSLKSTNLYYRLKQVDNDGKYQFSKAVRIKLSSSNKTVSIYPNPVKSMLNFVFATTSEEVLSLTISDISGKIMLQQTKKVSTAENNSYGLYVGNLPTGIYSLKIIGSISGEPIITKFIKQ